MKTINHRIAEVSFQKLNDMNISGRITLTDELRDIGLDLTNEKNVFIKVVEDKDGRAIVIRKLKLENKI